MDTIDLTVTLDMGLLPGVLAIVRFDTVGVVGVRALSLGDTPVYALTGITSADALLRAGLPLDRLDALSPQWGQTAVLPVLRALAQVQAQQGDAARDAILIKRYPGARDSAARLRLYHGTLIRQAAERVRAMRAQVRGQVAA